MASLAELVGSPALSPLLSYVARPRTDPPVERVALIDDLSLVDSVGERAIVLLTSAASRATRGYTFDLALRIARDKRTAAFVLSSSDVGNITLTATAIADRSGAAILGMRDDVDLAELTLRIGRELAGDSDVALLRAHAAVRAIEAHPANAGQASLVDRAGAALGVRLELVKEEPSSGPRMPVAIDGYVEGWLAAPAQDGDAALALDIVLHAGAAAVARLRSSARRAEELPIQSDSELLSELLSVPRHGRPPLVQRARDLGMPVDGWHVVVRMEFENLTDSASGGVEGYEARLDVARTTLEALRAGGGDWYSARAAKALLLVSMHREEPGVAATRDVARAVDAVLPRVRSRLPMTLIRCGVGSPRSGPDGLVAAAAEAKAAVSAARTTGRANVAVAFDSIGLRRTLVEWYVSDTAQDAVKTVLAPVLELGGAQADRLIQTLHVYLDRQGSLTKTAETLNLHRNAVAYRIKKVFSLLDVDPESADDLLLLQLACRAREL